MIREGKDIRLFLEEIADELPADSQARGLLLEAEDQMTAIFRSSDNDAAMSGPYALIRQPYELIDDVGIKGQLHGLMLIIEHMIRQSEVKP